MSGLETKHSQTPVHSDIRFENDDVSPRPVIITAALGAVVTVAIFGLMMAMFTMMAGRAAERSPEANPLAARFADTQPPLPRLQSHPIADLSELRNREDSDLAGFEWIDRPKGIVRVPIDRAMELFVKRSAANKLK